MIRYLRPPEPDGFSADAQAEKAEILLKIEPMSGLIKAGQSLKSEDFKNIWGAHKASFAAAQSNKCAYCERVYTGYGDVEHVLPKAVVVELADEGRELKNLGVLGRTEGPAIRPGYWWRAHDWSNYCFACNHCNSKWKRNFLSVEPPHAPDDPPRQGRAEIVLLLHPFDRDPADHLRVESSGIMLGKDSLGRETIRTLGLNRKSLIQLRRDAYRNARNAARLVAKGLDPLETLIAQVQPHVLFALARRSAVTDVFDSSTLDALLQLAQPSNL